MPFGTITTDAMAAQFVELLGDHGVTLTDPSGFATDFSAMFTAWMGGEGAIPADLSQRVATAASAWNTDAMQRIEWWTGTVNGGPNGDGLYPMTNAAGVTTLFPCMAKILASTAKGDSAYDVAVSLGYAGTEEEYAEGPIVAADYAQDKGDYALAKGNAAAAATADAQTVVTAGALVLNAAADVHVDRVAIENLFATVFSSDDFPDIALAIVDGFMRLAIGVKSDGTTTIAKTIVGAMQASSATIASLIATAMTSDALTTAKMTLGGSVTKAEGDLANGYVASIADMYDRIAAALKPDGTVRIEKLDVRSLTVAAFSLAVATIGNLNAPAATIDSLTLGPATTKVENLFSTSGGGAYLTAFMDSLNRVAAGLRSDGTIRIDKLDVRSLTAGSLNAPLGVQAVFQVLKLLIGAGQIEIYEEPAFVNGPFVVVDMNYRIGLGLRANGDPIGKFLTSSGIPANAVGTTQIQDQAVTPAKLASGAVAETKIDPPLARVMVPKATDVVPMYPDDLRGRQGRCANRTEASGYGWSPFPRVLTRALQGANDTGQALQFRRRSPLVIRGRRYRNAFDPAASGPDSKVSRGTFTSTTTWPPSGTFATGDYYEYGDGAITRTIGSDTYAQGDVAVYTGSAWARQARPPGASPVMGDWWNVTSAGWWKGKQLAIGDFLFVHGTKAQGGPSFYEWGKGAPEQGEFFLRGEWAPSSGLPSSPVNGEVYQVTAAGSTGGFTFAVDDYLLRDDGVWGQVPSDPITAVAAGGYVFLTCRSDSSEWEFRQTSKSASRVGIALKCQTQTGPRRSVDGIYTVGDSMVALIGPALSTAFSPRVVTSESYGGASFTDVLAMVHRNIRELGDPHRGKPHIVYAGQNAQSDYQQTEEQALRLMGLIGSATPRMLYLTVLGQRIASYSGGRLVFGQFEDQFNDVATNPIVRGREFFKRNIPDQWFDTRLAVLANAGSTPDLQFPGKTEAQVASMYGIPPLSAWLDYTSVGITPASMTFQGYWTADGLPTGGSANDYYLRQSGVPAITDNNSVGNILANIAGAWIEVSFDKTHFSSATVKTSVGSAIKTVFDTKGW
ncbi:hypothetical protein [Caulobacter sp. 1776]|uniref:hypothetical protein n=1 Tax=Caulobacter sp. 1776 TaxID=3156420 RepID=UPI003397217F